VLRAGSALIRSEQDFAALPIFRGVGLQSIEPQKSNRSFVFQKKIKKGLNSQKWRSRPAKICSTLIGPLRMKKIASSSVSSHPPPNKARSLMLQIDTCEVIHTNLYVINQSNEFVFTTSYPLVSPHIRLQINPTCGNLTTMMPSCSSCSCLPGWT
jgi:hypothetical protein